MTNVRKYQGSSRSMKRYAMGMIEIAFDEHWSAADKGRSTQPIPGIAAARHRAAMTSFKIAQAAEIPTHFEHELADSFVVRELAVPTHQPLSGFTHGEVLPCEFIWRTHLEGSLWTRVQMQVVDPVELGFESGHKPQKGEKLPRIFFECTTKFEPTDRKLSNQEACELMKFTSGDWDEAWLLIKRVVEVTTDVARRAGYYEPDGKLELGRLWDTKQLIVADTFGTQDENRIIHKTTGMLHSKDIIRNHLKKVGYSDRLKVAQQAHPDDRRLWPDYPPLPEDLVLQVVAHYTEFADDYELTARTAG